MKRSTVVAYSWRANCLAAIGSLAYSNIAAFLGGDPHPFWQGDTCTPKILGTNLNVRGHDLLQLTDGITDEGDCAAACCANSK